MSPPATPCPVQITSALTSLPSTQEYLLSSPLMPLMPVETRAEFPKPRGLHLESAWLSLHHLLEPLLMWPWVLTASLPALFGMVTQVQLPLEVLMVSWQHCWEQCSDLDTTWPDVLSLAPWLPKKRSSPTGSLPTNPRVQSMCLS